MLRNLNIVKRRPPRPKRVWRKITPPRGDTMEIQQATTAKTRAHTGKLSTTKDKSRRRLKPEPGQKKAEPSSAFDVGTPSDSRTMRWERRSRDFGVSKMF